MIVAVPLFGKRISPHFSTAPELLVVQSLDQVIRSKMRFSLSKSSLSERRNKLLSLHVQILICGGIDKATREWLERRDICVIADAIGEAEDVLLKILELRGKGAKRKE